MMLSVLPVGAFAAEPGAAEPENGVSAQAEEDAVAIDATNFPDGAFRQYVADNFDKDKDGALNQTERNAVKEIRISNSGCTSLQGLKYFSKLTDLFCSDNNLTELDVSENPELKRLICYNNSLTSLNLNKNTKLESLNCNKNKLTVLDLRENKSLWWLRCNNNCLTSLDLRNNPKIRDLQVGFQRYQILANDDRTYDLHQLPGKFELDGVATGSWEGGTVDPTTWILKANSTTVTYKYKVDDEFRFPVTLDVHWHNYQWNHDGTKHWRECTTANCPGLTDAQEAPHVYDNAKDKDCNTCGYVRPLYTVTTVNATAKLEDKVLDAPVAADTEVTLTAADASEGKTFAGWKLYKVVSDTESQITDETELANLLKNGTETTATLTMPAYNVKAEPYYSDIPYNITAVDCTVDKPEAPMGDTVTATRRALKANERFTGWTVTVNGVEQDTDDFLTPDANDPAKVRFTMPAENVEIKANFEGNPTLNIGDHVTANIDGSDASVPSGSTVPVGETVHLTAIAPDGQHFTGWTVKVGGEEQKADTFLTTPDENDPTKVTFTMPDKNVEVKATFAEDPIPEPDPVGPSDTGNIQGAISAVVIGAAAGAIIYEAGTGIYRVINMPGIPMPSNRIELAELLWEHAGKPEPVSTALYSDIDEGDTDAQKAARWAVEQDLMKDDADNNKFHPAFPVSKLRTCLTWNAAKEKGLFDKTEE
jgi:internalin-related protein